ncbi:MAG: hypothetical protein RLZZ450_65 [Pseudomonadota bacterium]|jgi:rubrerythrin
MAKKFNHKRTWLCEECGAAQAESDNPPDSCQWCACQFFDNLHDVLKARAPEQLEA